MTDATTIASLSVLKNALLDYYFRLYPEDREEMRDPGPINPGHPIHDAVCVVEEKIGEKNRSGKSVLPIRGWVFWTGLLQASRHNPEQDRVTKISDNIVGFIRWVHYRIYDRGSCPECRQALPLDHEAIFQKDTQE